MAERWNEQTAKSFADLADTAKLLSAEGTIDFNFTKAQLVAYLDTLYGALDGDLTAIAALTTTAFGRSLLELADAASGRTALDAQQQDALLQTIADASDFDNAGLLDKSSAAQIKLGSLTIQDVITMIVSVNSKNLLLESTNATGRLGLDFLYSGGGTHNADYFRFQFRPDQPDVIQTVYDSSAASFKTFFSYSYLTDIVKLGINASSKVGIGKTPAYNFDVNGAVVFSSWLGSAGTTLAGFSSTGAINGALYWITDGRKSGEGAAAGTGVWGVWDSATSTLYYQDSVSTGKTAVVA